jgi:hypothetical protein
MEKEVPLFEPKASCGHFPFFDLHKREPEGQRSAVAFFGLHFFGEAKKVSSHRATPGRQSQSNDSQQFKIQHSKTLDTLKPCGHDDEYLQGLLFINLMRLFPFIPHTLRLPVSGRLAFWYRKKRRPHR